ncbi:MAG: ammonium transporter, partial [SAR324 cluster bacterium]|nr:ammonium transporter [SAR324 cluster bacterium]
GAISVHGTCGAVGTILLGFLDAENGLFYGGGFALLKSQIIGVVSIGAWAFLSSLVLFKIVDMVIGLRVSEEDEVTGLDLTEHGASAYPNFLLSVLKS